MKLAEFAVCSGPSRSLQSAAGFVFTLLERLMKMNLKHVVRTTNIDGREVEIDMAVYPLVEFLNRMDGIKTLSCCQGGQNTNISFDWVVDNDDKLVLVRNRHDSGSGVYVSFYAATDKALGAVVEKFSGFKVVVEDAATRHYALRCSSPIALLSLLIHHFRDSLAIAPVRGFDADMQDALRWYNDNFDLSDKDTNRRLAGPDDDDVSEDDEAYVVPVAIRTGQMAGDTV